MRSSNNSTRSRTAILLTAMLAIVVAATSAQTVFGDKSDNDVPVPKPNEPADKSFVEKETLSVAPGGLLTVEADRGRVEVTTSDLDTVTVEVTRTVSGKYLHEADEILKYHQAEITQDGANAIVRARMKPLEAESVKVKGLNFDIKEDVQNAMKQAINRRLRNVHFRISIPRQYNVDLKTGGGSVSVADLTGKARCRTSGGSVKLGRIEGDVWAKTSGGSITAGDISGSAVAHTSGGSIRIGHVLGTVSAKTAGGSINVASAGGTVEATTAGGSVYATIAKQPKGESLFTTCGGSVHIKLARTLALDIEASGQNGRVSAPFIERRKDKNKASVQRVRLNGGGPKLVARTTSGNVRFDYIDDSKSSPDRASLTKNKSK